MTHGHHDKSIELEFLIDIDTQLLPSLSLDIRKEPLISLLDTIHTDIYAVANE